MKLHLISSFYFLKFTIALIFLLATTFVCAQNLQDERFLSCSTLFKCGNITGIGYPFWGSNRREYCGYQDFQLHCNTQLSPLIIIMGFTYKVLNIDFRTERLTLARTDNISQIICPSMLLTDNNSNLNTSSFDYSFDTMNITLYYDCPMILNNQVPILVGLSSPFNCPINGIDRVSFYVTRRIDSFPEGIRSSLGSCKYSVAGYAANALAINEIETNPTKENLIKALDQDFRLDWSANSFDCVGCNSSGGHCGYNTSTSAFACYCPDQPYPDVCPQKGNPWRRHKSIPGLVALIAGGVCIFMVGFYCKLIGKQGRQYLLLRFMKRKTNEEIKAFLRNHPSLIPYRFCGYEIKIITQSFIHELGKGEFGCVYKGVLRDGRLVAVKKLKNFGGDGKEFMNEVVSISATSHVNIVRFLGFCYEKNVRALIYEYMPNGSFDKLIRDRRNWRILHRILMGIAKGLVYLHRDCNTGIVHLDINPKNILLDEDLCPKISDFGLAKLCKRNQSRVTLSGTRGTVGYIAPEVVCRSIGEVSHKSDVYSYGMLIFEIVGVKDDIYSGECSTNEMYFPDWIYKCLEPGEIFKLHRGITEEEEETIRKMMIVGLWCTQTNPSDRPPISEVIKMLEGSLQSLQTPQNPNLSSTSRSQELSSFDNARRALLT